MSAQNFRKASTQRSEWQEFKEEHTCNEGVSYIKRLQIRKQGTDAKMRQCLEAGLLVSFHIKKTKWQNQKRVYFSAKIVGTKKINGSDNARCAENGIRL